MPGPIVVPLVVGGTALIAGCGTLGSVEFFNFC
jgi:hypothetical protein